MELKKYFFMITENDYFPELFSHYNLSETQTIEVCDVFCVGEVSKYSSPIHSALLIACYDAAVKYIDVKQERVCYCLLVQRKLTLIY